MDETVLNRGGLDVCSTVWTREDLRVCSASDTDKGGSDKGGPDKEERRDRAVDLARLAERLVDLLTARPSGLAGSGLVVIG